jgi:hypothetical protein
LESRLGAVAPWLLATYLIVPPLFKASIQPHAPVDLTVLLAIPTAAVGGVWLVIERDHLDRRQVIALSLWLALAVLVIAGVSWAPNTGLAARSAAYFVILATIPLLAAFPVAADEMRARRFLLTFVAAGLIFVVISTIALFAGELGGRAVIGTNRLGVARALLFVPLLGVPLLVWQRFGLREWIFTAVASLAVVLAYATTSRAALLFFIAVGVVLSLGALAFSRHRRRVLLRVGALVLGTTVVFVALSGVLPERSGERFAGLLEAAGEALDEEPSVGLAPSPGEEGPDGEPEPAPTDRPSSIVQRTALYRLAFALFLEHPVLGSGTAGFEGSGSTSPAVEGHGYPHNLVLQFASEFGLVGLALLAAMGGTLLLTWRPNSTVAVALGALLAFLLLNSMLSNGLYEHRMLWGVWLVLLAHPAVGHRTLGTAEPVAR